VRFPDRIPVKIVMLGAGGTGGHIAVNLYRILHAAKQKVRFILVDGDLVEEKNLVRQHFSPADLGQNKALALAERYAEVYGLMAEYIPEFIESDVTLYKLLESSVKKKRTPEELVILIGAVDNNKSHQMCDRVFYQCQNLVYIDSGNGEHNGQMVCGVRQKGKTVLEPVAALYPDILAEGDSFPTEVSCAEASVSAPQSIMANVMAATAVNAIIYNLVLQGELKIHSLTFSTQSVQMKSNKIKETEK
jgi:Dinucleotide-utilizing enzymes involved in molybdopterin and thiamine biosynthesis family 2